MSLIKLETAGESGGTCDCCGKTTKTVWGYLHKPEGAVAAYFVHWTQGTPQHFPNFDFLIGDLNNDSSGEKKLVSFSFSPYSGGGSFMAIDSAGRPAAKSPLCTRALTREEVIHDADLMELSTSLIDVVWLNDPRINELKQFAEDA